MTSFKATIITSTVIILLASQGEARNKPIAPVFVLPGNGFIQLKERYFDLQDKTLRFTPTAEGYALSVLPLSFKTEKGSQLDQRSPGWDPFGWKVDLPFAFPFGGETWKKEVFVNVNGNISFGESRQFHDPFSSPWPDGTMRSVAAAIDVRSVVAVERMISVLWAIYSQSGRIYVSRTGDDFVITWEVERFTRLHDFYKPEGRNVFQAALYSSGIIDLNYKEVAERDGIVGLFFGSPTEALQLDRVSDEGDVSEPLVDITSVEVSDLGTTLKFSIRTRADIPSSLPGGSVTYRVSLFNAPGDRWERCTFFFEVSNAQRSGTSCRPPPGIIGSRFQGNTVELFLSKVVLQGAAQIFWSADVISSTTPLSDMVASRTEPRRLLIQERAEKDLSQGGNFKGNTFEIFHYPAVSKDIEQALRQVYQQFPPQDDLAIVFFDFRVDDLYNEGPSTGPINVPVGGTGVLNERPRDGSQFGSSRLQGSLSPIYLGPRFSEAVQDGPRTYHGYAIALGWIVHELVHRWAVRISFRNPLTGQKETPFTDGCCHWNEALHIPSFHSVASEYSSAKYPERSPMGGNLWIDNGDGTFTREGARFLVAMGLSALDLYLMGLIPAQAVPETFLLQNLEKVGTDRFRAKKIPVRIEDIVAVEGPRVPSSENSPKEFQLGVYLVHEPGRPPHPDKLVQAQEIAGAAAHYFEIATGQRMRIYFREDGRLDFAQFGSGQNIRSKLIVANPSITQWPVGKASLFDQKGKPVSLQFNERLESGSFSFSVPPKGLGLFTSGASGELVTGSIQLTSSLPVGATILFSGSFGAAGVEGIRSSKSFFIPVESDGNRGIRTGIALSNPAAAPVDITLTLRSSVKPEQVLATALLSLSSNGQVSQFFEEIFSGVSFSNFRGVVEVSAPREIAGMAIRTSPGEYATLPVTTVETSNREFSMAQFADGAGFSSQLILINPSKTQAAGGIVKLFGRDGSPLKVDINGVLREGSFTFSVPPQGAEFFTTDGLGDIVVGSVQVTSDLPLGGTIIFSGTIGVAGVGAAKALSRFLVPIESDSASGIRTGVAFSNPQPQAVTVTLSLRNSGGEIIQSKSISLAGNGQLSRFPDELFEGTDFSRFTGTIEAEATAPVAAMAVWTGQNKLATFPVVSVD